MTPAERDAVWDEQAQIRKAKSDEGLVNIDRLIARQDAEIK